MRVLGIAFSARREGNCLSCVLYCLDKFREKGFEVELLNAYDLEITPCSHCEYECFNERHSCPINDDVPEIYRKLEEIDLALFGVPNYVGHSCGLYRGFIERAQALRAGCNLWKVPKGLVVLGNISAGGDMVLHEVLYDFYNAESRPEAVLIPAREYGRVSIKGDLIESPDVRHRLDRIVEMLCKRVCLGSA